VQDLSGNVYEWCHSLYKTYPYNSDDGREDPRADGRRVLRGGAFSPIQWYVRCAYRYNLNPLAFGWWLLPAFFNSGL
jgi:formylglycine-generating enzyme required for sulfatase activity